jgi:hypothetical protein
MITDALITIVVGILNGIFSLVPNFAGSDPLAVSGITGIGTKLGSAVGLVNNYFPVSVLAVCLGITFAIKTFGSVWAVMTWLYDRLPFKFT